MKRKLVFVFVLVVVLIVSAMFINKKKINYDNMAEYDAGNDKVMKIDEHTKMYVAHAGGTDDVKKTYMNSYEAISRSYKKGFRLIEIDLEWTTDGKVVLLHSWDELFKKYFESKAQKCSYKEFKKLKTKEEMTQLTLDDAMKLLYTEFKDLIYITDVKENNVKLLKLIDRDYKKIKNRIIPQVYSQEEYHIAKQLGYENVIYTLYRSNDTKEQIVDFASKNQLFAITMDTYWAHSDLPLLLKAHNVYTYAHTINDVELFNKLKNNGINGIYTDILFP